MKPFDLLIITPLAEEAWACALWFKGTEVPGEPDLKWMAHPNGLSIGLYTFKSMGSVVAAAKTAPLLQTYRPKNVLLLGIAAGRPMKTTRRLQSDGFRLGDVAFNKSIYYLAYGSVKGNKTPQIRALDPINQDQHLADFVKRAASTSEWRQQAEHLFNVYHQEYRNFFGGPRQKMPTKAPRVLGADVGSGELLVRSKNYQETVRKQFRAADISVFEMEAYAVGSVCRSFLIPFLTIRGISDHGTLAKDDVHRFAATLGPSALVSSLIEDPGTVESLVKRPFPLHNSKPSCLLPLRENPIPCPHDHAHFGPKCVDAGIRSAAAQPALLSRAFEHVEPSDFSHSLSDKLKTLVGKKERVVFFFPYSPKETMRLCAEEQPALLEELTSLATDVAIPNTVPPTRQRRIIELTREIASLGRGRFPHFKTCEEVCRSLVENARVNRADLPQYISRVIITTEELDRFGQNSLNLIYSFLLRTSVVPTFLWHASGTKVPDDITFFESLIHDGGNSDGDFNWLRAVRYFPRSWLMLTTGWPCSASGTKSQGEQQLGHISGLYREWKRRVPNRKVNGIDVVFRQFPSGLTQKASGSQ